MSTASSSSRAIDRGDRIRDVVWRVTQQRSQGQQVTDENVIAAHPDLAPELAAELGKLRRIHEVLLHADEDRYGRALDRIARDWELDPVEGGDEDLWDWQAAEDALDLPAATSTAGSSQLNDRDSDSQTDLEVNVLHDGSPRRIGRYRTRRLLGRGGFGCVYLAWDEELARSVAVKVPHAQRLAEPHDVEKFLVEARVVARLDHPAIVPVYDAGRTSDGECYIVSKLVRGRNLAHRIHQGPLSPREATCIVQRVAQALHYAHEQGLIHRDVKPANILLDDGGTPYVTDFGLATREDRSPARRCFAGTPAYMSPEQALGEAHRVDARSDVFSLGVVFYELLTGVKPFRADSNEQLLEEILHVDPPTPRQIREDIDTELERICLKAMAKRAAERYASAEQLAADLDHFLRAADASAAFARGSSQSPDAIAPPLRVVPKGLRAFDANDANFFLELVPGPRDREGLPESIRQWKARIEQRDPNESFTVGLIYGPSGCGKSSLVRAGLLPRLTPYVQILYVEASSDNTESLVRRRLAAQLPNAQPQQDLAATLADVRRGRLLTPGSKLLLVIDQFEQWLHGKNEQQRRRLVEALRQCDGQNLQCLLLVRDDFWLSISRFMGELEIDLTQGRNTFLVDLFDPAHANKVLTEFGRAFGRLPTAPGELTPAQQTFLQQAIESLADEGRVTPVRLALFAEMVKGRSWIPATLREVGGAAGIGVSFLDETFSLRTSNAQNRVHEQAARAVLAALMPEAGDNLRGHVRSDVELLDISGYGNAPRAFKELMRILDTETRLLTPTDLESGTSTESQGSSRYYQLTHDYLVPSLREWLTRGHKATRAGRARLRLEERAMMWSTRPERRQLPSLWEWATIRLLTRPSQWTSAQRQMMRAAWRQHLLVAAGFCAALLAFLLVGSELATQASNLLVRFRANTAAAWMLLGQEERIWDLLRHDADPTLRTQLIHGLNGLVVDPEEVVPRLDEQQDVSTRRAMLLLVGELAGAAEERSGTALARTRPSETLIQELFRIHREDADPGMHAAAEWALSRYDRASELIRAERAFAQQGSRNDRQWYVTSEGHTMAVIPGPAQFVMGSSARGQAARPDEQPRMQTIRRSFSLAAKETTAAQFDRFLRDHPELRDAARSFSQPPDHPRANVTWYAAAAYCNWLSQQEGIPREQWCYLPNDAGKYAQGMRVAEGYQNLAGYRLPTEAEWEYACRAGAGTERHFGRAVGQLEHYAVYEGVSAEVPLSVGGRKPNDFGLFDMHGNIAEWCHDRYAPSSEAGGKSASLNVSSGDARVFRGGSFRDAADHIRSSARNHALPEHRDPTLGFRVARSYP